MMIDNEDNNLNQGFSFDLGWLLTNQQIDDSALCQVLFDEYRPDLERLVFSLTDSMAETTALVNDAIRSAILNRSRYDDRVSGRAWLYGLAIDRWLRLHRRGPASHTHDAHQLIDAFNRGGPRVDPTDPSTSHLAGLAHSLGNQEETLLILQHGFDLTEVEIAYLTRIPLDRVRAALQEIHTHLAQHHQSCIECAGRAESLPDLLALLCAVYPTPGAALAVNLETQQAPRTAILDQITALRKAQTTRTRLRQIAQASLAALALLLSAWWLPNPTTLPATLHTQPATLTTQAAPTRLEALIQSSETPPPPEETPPPQETPLQTPTLSTAPAEELPNSSTMLLFMLGSPHIWHSIWVDVRINRYDSQSVAQADAAANATSSATLPDNPTTTRKQAWISRPFSRFISGAPDGVPSLTYTVKDNQLTGQNFESGLPIQNNSVSLIADPDLQKLLLPKEMLPLGGEYTVVGSATTANRLTWVIDWLVQGRRQFRLWVDEQYGVILHRQEFGGKNFQTVVADTLVTSIYFDAVFPQAIFSSNQYKGDHYASSFSGIPEIPDIKSASAAEPARTHAPWPDSIFMPGVDPALRGLLYQNLSVGWQDVNPTSVLRLYANHHYLGLLPLGGKALLSCEPSPNGRQMAYTSFTQTPYTGTALYLADLLAIQSAHPVLPLGITFGDFAFSPDGQKLAFFGCVPQAGFCGVFLLDTRSGNLARLAPLLYADDMVWNPDGSSLALVGAVDTSAAEKTAQSKNILMKELLDISQVWHFMVLDTHSGNILYKRAFDLSNPSPPSDLPTNTWGVPFQASPGNLESCINPPSSASH